MRKIMVLFLIIPIYFAFSGCSGNGEANERKISTKDLSAVNARLLIFQLSPQKSKAQLERNRNSIAWYFNKKHKDIYFGIYAGNISDKTVLLLQLTALDYPLLQEYLKNYDKSQFDVLVDMSLKGPIGFKFSESGVIIEIRTKLAFSNQEILKRLGLSNESHVQQLGGGSDYLVWINKIDYNTFIKKAGGIESFLKEKLQNEDFYISHTYENIEDKYVRQ